MRIMVQTDTKFEDLSLPDGLVWQHGRSSGFPPSYKLVLITNDEHTKSIICTSDSFGGLISYAVHNGEIHLPNGKPDSPIDREEAKFLRAKYPALLEEIRALGGDV